MGVCAHPHGPPRTSGGIPATGAQPGRVPTAVPLLWQQQLPRLAGQRVDPLGPGRRPRGSRQLLQDPGAGLWAAGPRLQHLQGGGRPAGAWAPWGGAEEPGAQDARGWGWGWLLWSHPEWGWTRLPSVPLPLPCQGGCITKLETFIQEHLRVIGAVGVGIGCVQVRGWGGPGPGGRRGRRGLALCCAHAGPVPQVFGMIFTCCLYRNLKLEHY